MPVKEESEFLLEIRVSLAFNLAIFVGWVDDAPLRLLDRLDGLEIVCALQLDCSDCFNWMKA